MDSAEVYSSPKATVGLSRKAWPIHFLRLVEQQSLLLAAPELYASVKTKPTFSAGDQIPKVDRQLDEQTVAHAVDTKKKRKTSKKLYINKKHQ